jgi:DivIVA domain-containing protein
MELTPQTLHAVEFREARRGGYNTRDVDDFIERVAGSVGHLNERVRDAQARAEAAEARLMEMQRELEELRRRPPAAAPAALAPPAPPAPEVSETDETLRRTLVLAQRTADATIKEAKEEANRVLSEAREEAARTRAEAEAEARRGADSARLSAEQEVEMLLSNRDKLKGDLDVITGRIEEQREQLRAGIVEMQRLLDDPSSFKSLPPVALTEVDRPAPQSDAARPAPLERRIPREPVDAAPPAGDLADADGGNGRAPSDMTSPFGPGAQVASLQEPPSPMDAGPPTQPMPFAVTADGRGPWPPTELPHAGDDLLGPVPAAPTEANGTANGTPPVPPDPSSRPSDWGRAVFDAGEAPEGERSRFGRSG